MQAVLYLSRTQIRTQIIWCFWFSRTKFNCQRLGLKKCQNFKQYQKTDVTQHFQLKDCTQLGMLEISTRPMIPHKAVLSHCSGCHISAKSDCKSFSFKYIFIYVRLSIQRAYPSAFSVFYLTFSGIAKIIFGNPAG